MQPGRAAWCSTATRTTSSPRPSRSRSAPRTSCPGIDFTNDPLLAGPHPLVRRHADHAPGRAQLPRDPDQRADRAGAQQPARRHAPPGDPPRPRRLRAELARRRLPVPGRRAQGFVVVPAQPVRRSDKVRGKPEKFADHYTQATLFFDSQTPVEQAHIVGALPLRAVSKVHGAGDPRAHGRDAAQRLRQSSPPASPKAWAWPVPAPLPRALAKPPKPEVRQSPALSLLARPGDGGIRTRKVAILVADGVDGESLAKVQAALLAAGAVPRLVGTAHRPVQDRRAAKRSRPMRRWRTSPRFLFDALVLPDGAEAVDGAAQGRPHRGVHQGPVPPLQDRSWCSVSQGPCSKARARSGSCPMAKKIPASSRPKPRP